MTATFIHNDFQTWQSKGDSDWLVVFHDKDFESDLSLLGYHQYPAATQISVAGHYFSLQDVTRFVVL